jgi:hypothetical protein
MAKKGKKQKQRLKNELRTLHSHIDERGMRFGYPHPEGEQHRNLKTQAAHNRTTGK